MNLEESQILYCGNDLCDDEATHVIKETQMPLCWCCANAYRLGSSNQHSLLAIDEKDEDSPFFVKTCSNCGTERDGLINCEQCDHVEPEVQQLIDRSAHYQVEYDLSYMGGDYSSVGEFAYIPVPLVKQFGINAAFEKWEGENSIHIVHYTEEEIYDSEENPVNDREIGEDGLFVEESSDD